MSRLCPAPQRPDGERDAGLGVEEKKEEKKEEEVYRWGFTGQCEGLGAGISSAGWVFWSLRAGELFLPLRAHPALTFPQGKAVVQHRLPQYLSLCVRKRS